MRAFRNLAVTSIIAVAAFAAQAQQPTPPMIVVQAANAPATTATAKPAATATSDSAITAAIKSLEQTKAANDAMLKKQEAMLQQLDELQKAAEQLKVFSKRV